MHIAFSYPLNYRKKISIGWGSTSCHMLALHSPPSTGMLLMNHSLGHSPCVYPKVICSHSFSAFKSHTSAQKPYWFSSNTWKYWPCFRPHSFLLWVKSVQMLNHFCVTPFLIALPVGHYLLYLISYTKYYFLILHSDGNSVHPGPLPFCLTQYYLSMLLTHTCALKLTSYL